MGTLWQFAFIIAKITVIVKKHVFHNSKRTMQIAHVRLVKLFMTGAEWRVIPDNPLGAQPVKPI